MKVTGIKVTGLAAGLVVVVSAGCSGGSGRVQGRDSGKPGEIVDGQSEDSTASMGKTDALPGTPKIDAWATPSDALGLGDTASLDTREREVAAKPDALGGDAAVMDGATKTDAPYQKADGGVGDLGKTDVPRDGSVISGDRPVERAAQAETGDSAPALATGFRQVAAGGSFTCALGSDDSLWCWGSLRTTLATPLDASRAWESLDLGGDSACAIAKDGTLWCWGTNLNNQLGLSGVELAGVAVPTQVGTERDWKHVSMGATVACGVRKTGALWCWGSSSPIGGEVGDGITGRHPTPVAIGQASDWTAVSAGDTHTCGLRAPGSLWCWGQEDYGQLGLGVKPGGSWAEPVASKIPARVGSDEDWTQVSAGGSHTCGIRSSGTLWCWGNNTSGQLGGAIASTVGRVASPSQVGTRNDWIGVSAGSFHTCALRADHTVWCWGSSDHGQVGTGGQTTVLEPTQVGSEAHWSQIQSGGMHTCGLKEDTSVWCWGRNHAGQLAIGSMPIHSTMTQVGQARDWERVTTQGLHACGLRADTLWCWGQNRFGKLGDGTTEDRQEPTRVGTASDWTRVVVGQSHTCGLRAGGSLWCWGDNSVGELGVGQAATPTTGIATTPQQVGSDKVWLTVDAAFHTCALASDGSLWCWGPNSNGVMGPTGSGFGLPTRLGADNNWIAISLDGGRTCGLRKDNSLWCWGYKLTSEPAQIGDGLDWRSANARYGYFCGIKNDGSLWCGDLQNPLSQRGSATDWVEATPACGVRASGALLCALASGPGIVVDPTNDWSTAGASDTITCGVKNDGTLWCMGTGQNGEMGHGDAWRTTPARALRAP